MDSDSALEVISILLERLRHIEKERLEAMSSLRALSHVVFAQNGSLVTKYKDQKKQYDETLATQFHDLDHVYDELIRLLKNPDPLEKDEQEKFRRMLEAFQGPKQ